MHGTNMKTGVMYFRAHSIRQNVFKFYVVICWLVLSEKCHTNMRRNINL